VKAGRLVEVSLRGDVGGDGRSATDGCFPETDILLQALFKPDDKVVRPDKSAPGIGPDPSNSSLTLVVSPSTLLRPSSDEVSRCNSTAESSATAISGSTDPVAELSRRSLLSTMPIKPPTLCKVTRSCFFTGPMAGSTPWRSKLAPMRAMAMAIASS
jgi:hypothetical protein